ncbi:MAG: exosortase-associated EpsI family protein [Pyrinomonadaceae bacterium]|nr:exosortase-associated EpsI family protein [Phycisphaerales bacterium]
MIRALRQPGFVVCLLLLVLGTAGLAGAVNAFRLYLRKLPIEAEVPVRSVPIETDSWKRVGKDAELPAEVIKTLGTENFVTRQYVEKTPVSAKQPRSMELHLAYYTGMVDTVPHVPDRCMVGGGFIINSGTAVLPVTLDTSTWRRASGVPEGFPDAQRVTAARLRGSFASENGREVILPFDLSVGDKDGNGANSQVNMRITDFADPKSGRVVFSGYFFIANGRLTSRAEDVRLLAFNLTDDYAYYLKVQVSSTQVTSAQELVESAQSLLSELFPEIMRAAPDWVEVRGRAKGKEQGVEK